MICGTTLPVLDKRWLAARLGVPDSASQTRASLSRNVRLLVMYKSQQIDMQEDAASPPDLVRLSYKLLLLAR